MPKNLLSSILPLVIAIVLFIVVGNFGIARILELQSQIRQANIDKNTLTQKLSTLQSLGSDLPTTSEVSLVALPDKSPALAVLSQIKNLAAQNVISISNIKTGSTISQSSDISTTNLSFDVAGPVPAILSFLNGIHKISPLAVVNSVKISETALVATASVNVSSFWSPLPTKIPAVNEPINTLTADEQTILTSISALVPPQFSNLSPSQAGRANPFAQ